MKRSMIVWLLLIALAAPAFAAEPLTAHIDNDALAVGQSAVITIEGGTGPFKTYIGIFGDELDMSSRVSVKMVDKRTLRITAREPLDGEIIIRDAQGNEARFPLRVTAAQPAPEIKE
ncbi:MAG: hypothetical protein AB1921_03590 [Thermodesulfobacteriota bacterium]